MTVNSTSHGMLILEIWIFFHSHDTVFLRKSLILYVVLLLTAARALLNN